MQYQDPCNSHWLVFVNAQHNVDLYINLRILEGQKMIDPEVFSDRSENR